MPGVGDEFARLIEVLDHFRTDDGVEGTEAGNRAEVPGDIQAMEADLWKGGGVPDSGGREIDGVDFGADRDDGRSKGTVSAAEVQDAPPPRNKRRRAGARYWCALVGAVSRYGYSVYSGMGATGAGLR
jgi:hypothetical protein